MLDKIIDYISNNLQLVKGENLFKNYYPDEPSEIVSVFDGGGNRPSLYTPTREKIVEIKLRSIDHTSGHSLGESIMDLFHDRANYLLGNQEVLFSYALTDISYLYADSRERDEFSFELAFLIQK